MSFIQNQHIKTGTATGNKQIPISQNYSTLHVAVEGATVTVKTIPVGLSNAQGDYSMTVTPDVPGTFYIVPSEAVILEASGTFTYSVSQQ